MGRGVSAQPRRCYTARYEIVNEAILSQAIMYAYQISIRFTTIYAPYIIVHGRNNVLPVD